MITDPDERKARPITTGVLDYFPDALIEVARVSMAGNTQHDLGPLHWDKSRSTDEADALVRHLLERGTTDTDGIRHTAKVAWRALALLQREIDAEAGEVLEQFAGADPEPERGPALGIPVLPAEPTEITTAYEAEEIAANPDTQEWVATALVDKVALIGGPMHGQTTVIARGVTTALLDDLPGRYERANGAAKFAHWRSAHAS